MAAVSEVVGKRHFWWEERVQDVMRVTESVSEELFVSCVAKLCESGSSFRAVAEFGAPPQEALDPVGVSGGPEPSPGRRRVQQLRQDHSLKNSLNVGWRETMRTKEPNGVE